MIALLAALSMIGQDATLTFMVIAENRENWWLAGLLDTAGWLLTLATLHWSLGAISGGWTTEAVIVVGAVSAANFIGTGGATFLGGRYIKDPKHEELREFMAIVCECHPEVAAEVERRRIAA
jgi:hypothetical protein